jgi:hypothetical protein
MIRAGMGTHRFRLPMTQRHARAQINSGWKILPLASVPALYLGALGNVFHHSAHALLPRTPCSGQPFHVAR